MMMSDSATHSSTMDTPTQVPVFAPPTSLFKNRSFMCLWLAQVFSQLADRVVFIVFLSVIATSYSTEERYVSFLYIAFTIPAVLLTAIAGVFVDRWQKKTTLVLTNVVRALLVLLLPAIAPLGCEWLYGLAFLLSAATQFFVPAESATIPAIVPKSQLLQANSLFTTTMMAALIIGFVLGDPLIGWLGLTHVHWALFGLFLLAALLLSGLTHAEPFTPTLCEPTVANITDTAPKNRTLTCHLTAFFQEMKEGWQFIIKQTVIWQAMLKLALLFSAVVVMPPVAISFAKAFLYADPAIATRKFAYLMAFAGVGMGLGAIKVAKPLSNIPQPVLVYSGLGIVGISLLGMITVPWLIPTRDALFWQLPAWQFPPLHISMESLTVTQRMVASYAWQLLLGIGASLVAIPLQALLHDKIPESLRGKVLGVQFTVLATSSTVPSILAGFAVERFGSQFLFGAMALPFIAVSIWGFTQLRKITD
jgi:MFS family permease